VTDILDAGINVISAVNIQHIESLYQDVKDITGIDVAERIPDSVLQQADEVVNIDLTADELVTRLKEGKIYTADKIELALRNFFQGEKILQLRERRKEVASQVERKSRMNCHEMHPGQSASRPASAAIMKLQKAIRKTAACLLLHVLYVQTTGETADKIALDKQRHLINNFKLATELGAEIIKVKSNQVAKAIMEQCDERHITTICIGKPHLNLFKVIMATNVFNELLKKLSTNDIDLVILS
jgi:two-component system sensor histidine kinase KdpD